MAKYTLIVLKSTSVVISGVAINAGSSPIFLDTIGNVHPTTFAIKIAHDRV